MKRPSLVLPIIVFAQFCCTSLWFAGNSVIDQIVKAFDLSGDSLAHLSSSVQFGFIAGTLVFAVFTIADRFSPSKVFFVCASLGALFNLITLWEGNTMISLLLVRSLTGLCLAGIYPVGMKITADYFDKGLGKSLGYLVGALVLGTAFPHILNVFTDQLDWSLVMQGTSGLALLGGSMMIFWIPDGPYRKSSSKFDAKAMFNVFQRTDFRAAAFGYFGHMWELYAFWVFVPVLLQKYILQNASYGINVSGWSFLIIGIGALSCVFGGYLSSGFGAKKVAQSALFLSGICCVISVLSFDFPPVLFLSFMLFWGIVVIMDSPMFSTLVAQSVDPKNKATGLTIVNCIGFSITIVSIQLLSQFIATSDGHWVFVLLSIGPFFGLIGLGTTRRSDAKP
ncbi:MAG: MFS transporter [Cyclobacteriaceae bacterium]